MAEFTRSRLEKKKDEDITRKTVFLGIVTVIVFIVLVIFGLPFLINLSVFLGNIKKNTTEVKEKVLPPMAPRIILPFESTNSSEVKVSGFAEKNVTVELLKNDVSIGKVITNDNGEFQFDDIKLDNGDNIFFAIAISDQAGSSEPSKDTKVAFDDVSPQLTMTNPSEEALKVDVADFDITGNTEKAARVTINGRIAMVDDNGQFKLKYQLSAGKNAIEIVVRDLAGNETKKSIEITYDI
jgi:hypothetical protein